MEIQSDLSCACIGICFTHQKHKGVCRSRGCQEHQQGQQQNTRWCCKPEPAAVQSHLKLSCQQIHLPCASLPAKASASSLSDKRSKCVLRCRTADVCEMCRAVSLTKREAVFAHNPYSQYTRHHVRDCPADLQRQGRAFMGVEEDHRTTAREAVTPVLQYFIFHIKPMQIWI